jgi:hypothetical protein
MPEETPRPQINSAKLRIGGEIVGLIFTIGSMLIFLTGIPVLRYIFPIALVLGCVVALALHFVRHSNPGAPWLIAAIERKTELPPQREREKNSEGSAKVVALPIAAHI